MITNGSLRVTTDTLPTNYLINITRRKFHRILSIPNQVYEKITPNITTSEVTLDSYNQYRGIEITRSNFLIWPNIMRCFPDY